MENFSGWKGRGEPSGKRSCNRFIGGHHRSGDRGRGRRTACAEHGPPAGTPDWIAHEKIRAAYFSQWGKEELPGKIAEAGFNTAFVAFCRGADHFEKWSKLARENKLRFFATLWFDYLAYNQAIHGPGKAGPKTLSDYRSFVHRKTGPHAVIVCPADEQYWADWITPTFLDMAKLDLEHGGLDGIILDAELYGPLTTRPAIPVSFYMDVGPCMGDDCFGDFLNQTNARKKPADLQWKDRHHWLVERKLTGDYNRHLRDRVAVRARKLEQQVHAINPDLLLGFMCWYRNNVGGGTGENYFLHGLLEGLKTAERPVMVWTENPEYSAGYGPRTDARRKHFQSVGDVIYIPALYLEQHALAKLGKQIHDLARHSDGYWIFTRHHELLTNSAILGFFKGGNDKIVSDAPPISELPFMDLWEEYERQGVVPRLRRCGRAGMGLVQRTSCRRAHCQLHKHGPRRALAQALSHSGDRTRRCGPDEHHRRPRAQ